MDRQKITTKRTNSGIRPPATKSSALTTSNVLLLIISHAACFLIGSIFSSSPVILDESSRASSMLNQLQQPECPKNTTASCRVCPVCPPVPVRTKFADPKESVPGATPIFPKEVKSYAVGMAHTRKSDFTNTFEIGVPVDSAAVEGERDVLFLYSKNTAMPTKMQEKKIQDSVDYVTAKEASENCDLMHVIFQHRSGSKNLCLAVVPQYESFHIQNWMRLPEKGPGDSKYPLRMVGRGQKWDGLDEFAPPSYKAQTSKTWEELKVYIDTHKEVLEDLKKIVKKIKKENTVIVMVANFGQAQLMENFVCAARSRGFDLSTILLFATDEETLELAHNLNLTAYYDEKNFGHMTKEAAREYGDRKFVQMMMAKVISVHMVSLTGVDFLFQDLDIIWYKHPLDFFHDKTSPIYSYDAIFQDDGARSIRYQPYSANSGFYFIRNNARTQYFLTQLVLSADLILKTYSHQQALVAMLAEHASLYGLKVKVISKEDDGFPGGVHFHRGTYFKRFFKGETDPWIFHMSWTLNKDNKLLFLRQLGEWYVEEQCVDKNISQIALNGRTFADACCSQEAIFSCHYRDKPSKKPCHDSPPIDKNGKDFWQ